MSNEMFYKDKGEKADKLIHKELLGDDDGPRVRSLAELSKKGSK